MYFLKVQKLWHIGHSIEIIRDMDTQSEIIHMSQNYLSAMRCLTRQAVWSRTSRVCWTLSILIFEISSREGALSSFARVNIGSSDLTLIAQKGTNVILIVILEQRISDAGEWKIFFRLSRIAVSCYSIASIYICIYIYISIISGEIRQ